MAEQAPFYVFAGFIFTYGATVLHTSRDLLLTALLIATGLSAVTTPLAGHISDLIGRKRMYLIGAVAMGLYAFAYFALLNTAIPAVIFIAIILSFIPHDMMYGPQAALITECFSPRLRYNGSSLGYHLAWWSPAGRQIRTWRVRWRAEPAAELARWRKRKTEVNLDQSSAAKTRLSEAG